MSSSCNVCIEDYTKLLRKNVTCPYCNYDVCMKCTKTYILGTLLEPHCMNCKTAWSMEFLTEIFTKSFVKGEYRQHRQKILFEREKSLLQETMPYVEIYIKEKRIQREIEEIYKNNSQLLRTIRSYTFNTYNIHNEEDFNREMERYKEKQQYEMKLTENRLAIELLEFQIRLLEGGSKHTTERRNFVRACPAEGCIGFLSSQWKCGICNIWVCHDCHEIKGIEKNAEHNCLPENIETAKLLAKDTKPCPKCASMIFKIDGCDQIFCTQCKIAFSWNTGRIETNRIHNPHYYEYMRQQNGGEMPREIGDIPCGGLPNERDIRKLIYSKVESLNMILFNLIMEMFRVYNHIQEVELVYNRMNAIEDNRHIRILFFAKEMTEEDFKRELIKREKVAIVKRMNTMILEMVSTTTVMIMQRLYAFLMESPNKMENASLQPFILEYAYLMKYANETIETIEKTYLSKRTPYILKQTWRKYEEIIHE